MFPGTTTKLSEKKFASATTISADADVLILTGTTTIQTIIPRVGGVADQVINIIPLDGTIDLGTSGNIAVAETALQNKSNQLIFSKLQGKWYPASYA